jgi:hypothetical protein
MYLARVLLLGGIAGHRLLAIYEDHHFPLSSTKAVSFRFLSKYSLKLRMASNILATHLLFGFLFVLALFYLCQGSPAAPALHAYPADEDFLDNATLAVHARDDYHEEGLLHLLSKRAPPTTVA